MSPFAGIGCKLMITYSVSDEEEALIRCLQLSCVSPMTREPLDPGYLQNTVLRQLIEEWRKASPSHVAL